MKRRKFIALTIGGISAVSLSGLLVFNKDLKKIAVEKILSDLNFLNLDKKGVELFVMDYFNVRNFSYILQLKTRAAYIADLPKEDFKFWYYLTHDYLLSTDFFENRMSETHLVKYTPGMNNPFKRACSNPFSHYYYPTPTQVISKNG